MPLRGPQHMVEIRFVTSDSMYSVLAAAGIDMKGTTYPSCPFAVGDVVSSRIAPAMFFRVTSRWFVTGDLIKPPAWHLMLEQASDPLATLASAR